MKKNFYAVKNGKVPGIYKSWSECKEQIDGYSGAEYKGFATEQEALDYYMGTATISKKCEAIAYTDGSYSLNEGKFSYGVVLFIGEEKLTFSKAFAHPEMALMRNVAGEITGAAAAMKYCVENNIKSLEICYDYEGVEKWCTGQWKTNKEGTKRYKQYYDSISDQLMVVFTKVKGHSGNTYNDEADKLAKEALGIV